MEGISQSSVENISPVNWASPWLQSQLKEASGLCHSNVDGQSLWNTMTFVPMKKITTIMNRHSFMKFLHHFVPSRASVLRTLEFPPNIPPKQFLEIISVRMRMNFFLQRSSWHRKLFDASSEARAPLKSRHCLVDCCNKNGCSGLQLRYSFAVWELTKYQHILITYFKKNMVMISNITTAISKFRERDIHCTILTLSEDFKFALL